MGKLPTIYFKNEDDLAELFCELMNCSGEIPTESDPTGCTGCDASEEWMDKHYSNVMIDETDHNKKCFVEVDELNKYLSSVMNIRNDEKTMRNMIIDLQKELKEKNKLRSNAVLEEI